MLIKRIADGARNTLVKLSLRQIMSIGVALGILLPALLFSQLFLRERFQREVDAEVRAPMEQSADMLAQTMSVALWNVDHVVADQTVQALMRNPDVVRVAVTDEVGNRFVDVRAAARRRGQILQDKRPVMLGERVIGQVLIEVSTERARNDLIADFLKLLGALSAQVLVSFFLILLLFEYRVVRPLRFLQLVTARLARGELQQQVRLKRSDEIGNLALSLDDMRAELGGLIAERDQHNASLQQELNERQRAEQALRASEAKFTAIFQTAPLAMIVAGIGDGFAVVDINDAGLLQFEVKRHDVVGGGEGGFSLWKDAKDAESLISLVEEKGSVDGFEAWMRCGYGEKFMLCQISGRQFTLGSEPMLILALEDVTERKFSEAVIWNQANFDRLSGLPNRHMFQDRLEQAIMKANRAGTRLGLMFLDLDRFKEVNDTLGHEMGDDLLKQASARLRACVRQTDTVARMGGDEFTIILDEITEAADVTRIAQNILKRMAEPFQLGEEVAFISSSIGITFYPEDATEIATLLKNADQAMYAAKAAGRNTFHHFMPAMQLAAQTRMRMINDLRGALGGKQFKVYYQPIVDTRTGAIHKAEALIRWLHPQHGLVSPASFIPLAEETRMIVEIGDWVFREALHQAAAWRKNYRPDFQVSINVSPLQFRGEGNYQSGWLDTMRTLGLPGQSVAVEITEGLLLDADAEITDKLLAFRDAGVTVSLDDFGTGYSSLSYLKRFDIDYLKIDRSFVHNMETDSNDLALCDSIIVMAHRLGLQVIAEGVETREQHDLLVKAGCDYLQGFLFARPLPPEEFEALLAQQKAA
ncbi:MAG TPA: EAL domain-containing protein [Burkholderiaceae bacterium]